MIQFAILALLRSGPDYGYRLRHRFDREIGSAWCLNVGQVYQSLQALESKGLVAEAADPVAHRDRGGPGRNRRVFAITEKGQRSLERWLRRVPTRPRPLRDEMLLRLFAASRQGEATLRQVLAAGERAHRDRRERAMTEWRRAIEIGTPLGRLGLEAEIARLEVYLEWLERCRGEMLSDSSLAEPPALGPAGPPASRSESRPPERALPARPPRTATLLGPKTAVELSSPRER